MSYTPNEFDLPPNLSDYSNPQNTNSNIFQDIGILTGGILGATGIGAAIGAVVGTFALPVLGTAAGAVIGALLGAGVGFAVTGLQGLLRGRLIGGQNPIGESVASGALIALGATGIGALIGTILFPGIGTAIGAGIGVFVGLLPSVAMLMKKFFWEDEHSKPKQLIVEDFHDLGAADSQTNGHLYTNSQLKPSLGADSQKEIVVSDDESSEKQTGDDSNSRNTQPVNNLQNDINNYLSIVFKVPELLNNILIFLNLKELFNVRTVSKNFLSTITNNTKELVIQKRYKSRFALFVKKPDGSTVVIKDAYADNTIEEIKNKFLEKKLTRSPDYFCIFGGRLLKNESTLQKQNVGSECTLHFIERTRGD